MTNPGKNVAGSFRDPKGHVYELDNTIYRTISKHGINDYEKTRDSGILDKLVEQVHMHLPISFQKHFHYLKRLKGLLILHFQQ